MSNVRTLGTRSVRITGNPPVKIVVVPGPPGPRGPAGGGGDGGAAYDHTQLAASNVWSIAHNLGFRPNVSTASVGGMDMRGEVQHLSNNVLTISFVKPVAGTAHLS